TAAALVLAACTIEHNPGRTGPGPDTAAVRRAAHAITSDGLLAGIAALSHDSMEGRAPGTPGEDRQVAQLERAYAAAGLRHGTHDCAGVQAEPLVGYTDQAEARLSAWGRQIILFFRAASVAVSRHYQSVVSVDNSDLVFVGDGVV